MSQKICYRVGYVLNCMWWFNVVTIALVMIAGDGRTYRPSEILTLLAQRWFALAMMQPDAVVLQVEDRGQPSPYSQDRAPRS